MATKRLARRLGLIRRKSVTPASGNPGGSRLIVCLLNCR
uniref:Exoribonuclease 2 n=1 Tax=Mus musculus TaxID=10090 RepID=F8WH13_MOUSE